MFKTQPQLYLGPIIRHELSFNHCNCHAGAAITGKLCAAITIYQKSKKPDFVWDATSDEVE